MSENKFPISGFGFLSEEEISDRYGDFEFSRIDRDSDTGYILEVDLEYPPELHDLHNDYPLAPETMTVTEEMLGPYAKTFPDRPKPTKKLIPNLLNKTKYVLHYENLKLYLKLGLKLTCIHRVLKFKQKAWMKEYVDFCIDMRKKATSDFEKDFWKLCVNAVFGKSMENVRNRVNIRLLDNEDAAIKAVAKPTFTSSRIINDDLVMIHMRRLRVLLNKPIYTGFCILDLSKALMYEFHYNYILSKYGKDRAKLLFTDTDSLCYQIETDDLYRDMLKDSDRFDTSNFDPNDSDPILRSLYSVKNKKVLGKFKSETAQYAPMEFVGLRAKMYSLLLGDGNKMTAKGIKKTFVKHHINHSDFVKTLESKRATRAEFLSFASKNHRIKTVEIKKVGLSAYDDKRYILDDGMSSYAYGHKNIT